MLEREMKVTPKELWAVVPKLQAALKEILTSKQSAKEEPNCYKTPKEERISRVFGNLIDNIKLYNRAKL